jgi:hypothetical protein
VEADGRFAAVRPCTSHRSVGYKRATQSALASQGGQLKGAHLREIAVREMLPHALARPDPQVLLTKVCLGTRDIKFCVIVS